MSLKRTLNSFLVWLVRNHKPPVQTLATILPLIALRYVGRSEFPKGSNRGPELQEFFDADSYDPNGSLPGDDGYPWCASFVCRMVQLAMEEWRLVNNHLRLTFKRPTTARAFGFIDWSRAQDASTKTITDIRLDTIKSGDIVVLKVSHILIATSDADEKGKFESVEGNTNVDGSREGWQVVNRTDVKKRSYLSVKAVIRFTV